MRHIIWFRRDLRVIDNPLLSLNGDVFPIFIFDTDILENLRSNDRRMTFIFNAVHQLKSDLKKRGLDLAIFYGKPAEIFKWLLDQQKFDDVSASGDYDSYALKRDRDVSHLFPFNYLQDTYIFHPDEVLKKDGTPYLVFTPFYNRVQMIFNPAHMAEISPAVQILLPFDYDALHCIKDNNHTTFPISLSSIGFVPQHLTALQKMTPEEKLIAFADKLANYPHDRDFMILAGTSGLSCDLRFGTIGVRTVLRWLSKQKKLGINTEPFFRQLIFRDFYAMLLYHFPRLETQTFRYNFKGVENHAYFEAFCTARTGVPIIDAGINELLETGEMHNRVRMIAGSYFTKNLLLPWQWGEHFFAQHLMDYDASSNVLSWQWCAGTGVDPQPYFRIFNPYTQSGKFDKNGDYIKKHLPQLHDVPPKIFAEEESLIKYTWADYSKPIVNHKESSKKALEHFKNSL